LIGDGDAKSLKNLELDHLTLSLLITSQFKVFATLQWSLFTVFALSAFHTQYDLFGSFSLLPENRLGLTTETLLFSVVTSSTLSAFTLFRLFVLCYFMQFVAFALLAKRTTLFWYIHHLHDFYSYFSSNHSYQPSIKRQMIMLPLHS